MHRVLIAPQESPAQTLIIREPEALHHLSRVLRVQAGEAIECLDGEGSRFQGSIQSMGRREISVSVRQRVLEKPPELQISLAQSLIKQEHFEWILQKAAELGVSRIIPLITSRTLTRESGKGFSASRLSRWRRILESASVQCGRAWLPILGEPQHLEEAAGASSKALKLIFAAAANIESISMVQALEKASERSEVVLFIGPEGDFSREEVAHLKQAGGEIVWLGERVLRADTVAVAAVAILQMGQRGLFSPTNWPRAKGP